MRNQANNAPLAPILSVCDLDDAVQVAHSTAYGLSSAVVTRDLNCAIELVERLKTGTVNSNEVPTTASRARRSVASKTAASASRKA
jgi:aldehyde dehydrogenase (NAD+)